MNNTRRGKIARMPYDIRELLNYRMRDGEQGKSLVDWLNSLPEVQVVLALEFDGIPLSEPNLTQWRQGGHQEWLLHQDALEAVQQVHADAVELQESAGELTDKVAVWLTARYLVAAQEMEAAEGKLDWKRLREFCSDLVALRRGDHSNARLMVESKRQLVQESYLKDRYQKKIILGLETLRVYVEKHPKAMKAFNALLDEVHTPFDKMEEEMEKQQEGEKV